MTGFEPATPSQVRYQAALHPELFSLRPAEAGHYMFIRLKPDTTCACYADARLLRLAGRAGFRAAAKTRFDATAGFVRAAIANKRNRGCHQNEAQEPSNAGLHQHLPLTRMWSG